MTTGLAENGDRDLHVGAGRKATLLRVLHTQVAAAGFAHGGDAGGQRATHALGGEEEVQRERGLHAQHRIEVAVDHEVHVAVDEAGVHRVAGGVDLGVAVEPRADRHDAPMFQHDIGGVRFVADAVDHDAATNQETSHCPIVRLAHGAQTDVSMPRGSWSSGQSSSATA